MRCRPMKPEAPEMEMVIRVDFDGHYGLNPPVWVWVNATISRYGRGGDRQPYAAAAQPPPAGRPVPPARGAPRSPAGAFHRRAGHPFFWLTNWPGPGSTR